MRNTKVLMMLVVISICTPAVAQIGTRGQCICDPWPSKWYNGYTQGWNDSGYVCTGWIPANAIVRFEIRTADINGGPTGVHIVEDVDVVPVGSPGMPQTAGDWGRPLLAAIADHNDVLVAGPILGKVFVGRRGFWNQDKWYYVEMAVNSAPNTRIAIRCISTAQGGVPLPGFPFMPPPTAAANNWPAGPDPYQIPPARGVNYDCVGCGLLTPLGLVGGHIVARPPDWDGIAKSSPGNKSNPDNEEGRFMASPAHAAQSGPIFGWGKNDDGQLNVGAPNSGFVAISAGAGHSLGLKDDGTVCAWGRNDYGQCNVPAPNSGFVAIAAGHDHSLGLKEDGTVCAWGYNDDGQCNIPAPNSGFIAIAGGSFHNLGLKGDGSVVGWGLNVYGQCNVPDPNGFVAISAGDYHSLGLKVDGTACAWGWNEYGQCNVPDPNGFIAIAAGGRHSLGLKEDGTACAWGLNDNGQCNVPDANDFIGIAGGGLHSLGLKEDSSVMAWGYNFYGQCNVSAPNSGFVAIAGATGGYHSLGLKVCQYGLIGDTNIDCRFDLLDFSLMATNWLIDCFAEPSNPACMPIQ